MKRRKKEDSAPESPSEGGPERRAPPSTPNVVAEAPSRSGWPLCSCQTVAVVCGAIAVLSFFFGKHLFPMIAEDIAVLKGTEKTEPFPVHEDVMELFRFFDLIPDGKIDPVEFDQLARYLPRRREVGQCRLCACWSSVLSATSNIVRIMCQFGSISSIL